MSKKMLYAMVLFFFLAGTTFGTLAKKEQFLNRAHADNSTVDIWWPQEGAKVSGVQPFKIMLQNWRVEDYQAFWQVDGGQLNSMYDSNTDYPHKEAMTDVGTWNWKGSGPYKLNFVVKSNNGEQIGNKEVNFYVDNGQTTQAEQSKPTEPTPSAPTQPEQSPTPAPTDKPASSGGTGEFYLSPTSQVVSAAEKASGEEKQLLQKIADQSQAIWLGNWNADVKTDVEKVTKDAESKSKTPVFIAYNIPFRDCGGYSAGGASSEEKYKEWIGSIAQGIGNRKSIVVLEPDALTGMDCLNDQQKTGRINLLKDAAQKLGGLGGTKVYIDSGHPNWKPADEMAKRLKDAGIDKAAGFSLNVSNFVSTEDNKKYGNDISSKLGGAHFIIDTSRNGNGPDGSNWCNPRGRALGERPTTNTGSDKIDAFLWLKAPGESDGSCNGAPAAGVFWQEYAIELAKNAKW